MNLSQMKQASVVEILSLDQLETALKRRLNVLGIQDGSQIQVKKKMIFNGPFIIEYSGKEISIRERDAKKIEVKAS